jgi:hypothetical protein
MKVNWIVWINLYRLCKVLDSFIKFVKTIPNKSSTVVGWCILWVYLYHHVKVFQRFIELFSSYLFSYGSKMMQRRDVVRLKSHSSLIVSLRLIKLSKLVPTKSSIVICLEMLWVNLNSVLVVFDCVVKFSLFPVGEASIVIKVSLIRHQTNSLSKALNSFIVGTFSIETYALVVICICIIRINIYSRRIISDSFFKLADFVKCKTSVEESFEMVGHDVERFSVLTDCSIVVSSFPCFIALGMELFSVLLSFQIFLLVLGVVDIYGFVLW